MDSLLFTLVSFIVALAILIAVHEFGHFWVARRLGVKVLRFSIGFGKPLWRHQERTQRGGDGTEYVLAAIPLGGYVKMLDEREGEVPEGELHRAFNRQRVAVRSAIVAAGPLFNFLFTILAFWFIFMVGDPGTRAIVGEITPGTPASQAGFLPGDEIREIGDRFAPTWESALYAILSESDADEPLPVRVIDADGNPRTRELPAGGMSDLFSGGNPLQTIGLTPLRPRIPATVGQVVSGEAAELAGLQQGDRLLTLDGRPIEGWQEFVAFVRDNPGRSVNLELLRGQERLEIGMTIGKQVIDGGIVGRIGAGVAVPEGLYDEYRTEIRYGPLQAFGASLEKSWDMSIFLVKMVGRMLTGEASVKNLSGPISIAETAGKTASYGIIPFIKFLALVSLSLGVLNLLPIPILDGGHLFFFLIEAIKGSPLSDELMLQGQKIGLALLLALMLLAFYVDISRLLG